jgi:hypothetical protein
MLSLDVTASHFQGRHDIQSQVWKSCKQYVNQLMLFKYPSPIAQDSFSDSLATVSD